MPNFMPSPQASEHSSPDFRVDSPHSDDLSEQQEGRRNIMKIRDTVALGIVAVVYFACSAVLAQNAPPTYQGDPDVYKVIFEDQNFRVIEVLRRKGIHDKTHSHPVPSVVYNVTDCKTKLYAADGKTTDNDGKAGTAGAVPVIASHSAENIGPADCKQVFVEKKM
jgi:hypothetical protein